MDLTKYQNIWSTVYSELSKNYASDIFEEVFEDVKTVVKFNNGLISVLVPNLFIQNKINSLYIFKINDILMSITPEILKFKFITKEEIIEQSPIVPVTPTTKRFQSYLKPSSTFESFVVGDSNRLSFRMGMSVADQPGEIGNPFFIFGGVGLGKTHLMHAVGNYMLEKDINKKILYIQASEFVRDYQKASTSKNMAPFEEKYGDLDALLVDDIQMLKGAAKSQDQFFQLFNSLYDNKKQIIITSDSPAEKLDGIMNRLTTRFAWGYLADIKVPELTLRVNILKRKIAENNEDNFDESVLEFIAKSFPKNVRSLESALTRVLFYCVDSGLDVNLENTKEALAPLIDNKLQEDSDDIYEKLLSVVTDYYNITIADLLSSKRSYKFVLPRHICMYVLKNKYNLTYKKIGNILGGRDHSTVMAACNKIEDEINTDIELKDVINTILKKLNK